MNQTHWTAVGVFVTVGIAIVSISVMIVLDDDTVIADTAPVGETVTESEVSDPVDVAEGEPVLTKVSNPTGDTLSCEVEFPSAAGVVVTETFDVAPGTVITVETDLPESGDWKRKTICVKHATPSVLEIADLADIIVEPSF